MVQAQTEIKEQIVEGGRNSLLDLEIKTGRTVYEIFAACYLSHLLTNEVEGVKTLCPPTEMHSDMCRIYRKSKRAVIVLPAKCGKSTWASIIQPIVDGCLGLVNTELSISNTGRMAEKFLERVKIEFETNEMIKHDFGDLKGRLWRQDQIQLRTGFEFTSLGLNYQIRSGGWDKIVGDDLEDKEMVSSSEQRDKFSDWYDGEFLGRMQPQTALFLVGNFIHPLCKLKKIYDNLDGRYSHYDRVLWGMQDEGGHSTWVTRWSDVEVAQLRIEMGDKAFLTEKMNTPIFGMDHIFRSEHFKYYDKSDLPKDLYIVTSLDASSGQSKEVGDYSALSVWGKDLSQEKYYLLFTNHGRWDTYDKVRAIFDVDLNYNPDMNLVESDAYGKELVNVVEAEKQRKHRYIPIRKVTPDKSKGRRAEAVTDMFHKGQVYFPKVGARVLIDQLMMFNPQVTDQEDDYVDSAVYALTYLRRIKAKTRQQKVNYYQPRVANAAGRLV